MIGTISIVFAVRRLSGAGMCQYVRSLVLKGHIIYLVLFTISNLYIVAICILYIKFPEYNPNDPQGQQGWKLFLKFLFYAQGFVLPVLRLSEDGFRQVVSNVLDEMLTAAGIHKKATPDRTQEEND